MRAGRERHSSYSALTICKHGDAIRVAGAPEPRRNNLTAVIE